MLNTTVGYIKTWCEHMAQQTTQNVYTSIAKQGLKELLRCKRQ